MSDETRSVPGPRCVPAPYPRDMPAFRNGPVGPAPDPAALRRSGKADQQSWIRLPCRGLREAPGWPTEALDPDNPPNDRVFAYWDRIWCEYPQAHIWKRQRMEMQVATYCRLAVLCASTNARSTSQTMLRQFGQELLITPHAMRAARVVIDEALEEIQEDHSRLGIAPVIALPPPSGGSQADTSGSLIDRMRSGSAVAPEDDDDEELEDEDQDEDEEMNNDGE